MHEVALLLENLFLTEASTVKQILDRLYDIGSVHIIDQKVSPRPLKRLSKAIAPGAKPVFRVVAFIWFRKNCPELITNWLYKKVTMGQSLPALLEEIEEAELEQLIQTDLARDRRPSALPAMRQNGALRSEQSASVPASPEIHKLRSQVQFLLGALVGTVILLGSTTLWLMRDSMPLLLRPAGPSTTACTRPADCQEAAAGADRALESD
ncbi:MAG: hypothetical protein ACFB4J_15825 [Elainellaceae cyanobacterium]